MRIAAHSGAKTGKRNTGGKPGKRDHMHTAIVYAVKISYFAGTSLSICIRNSLNILILAFQRSLLTVPLPLNAPEAAVAAGDKGLCSH